MVPASPPVVINPEQARALATLLQAERDGFAVLVGMLQTEQEAMVRNDADSLAALAAEKSSQLAHLSQLESSRSKLVAPERLAMSAPTAKIWQELRALATTARQLNADNGKLIELALRRNRQKLQVLQGPAASAGVYRPDGHWHSGRGQRSLSQV